MAVFPISLQFALLVGHLARNPWRLIQLEAKNTLKLLSEMILSPLPDLGYSATFNWFCLFSSCHSGLFVVSRLKYQISLLLHGFKMRVIIPRKKERKARWRKRLPKHCFMCHGANFRQQCLWFVAYFIFGDVAVKTKRNANKQYIFNP